MLHLNIVIRTSLFLCFVGIVALSQDGHIISGWCNTLLHNWKIRKIVKSRIMKNNSEKRVTEKCQGQVQFKMTSLLYCNCTLLSYEYLLKLPLISDLENITSLKITTINTRRKVFHISYSVFYTYKLI